jgi:pyruvate formate lyase activating enzyme
MQASGVQRDAPDPKGAVFHIIHGSFVDGPGVRTTVFLKGCPLRCVWCCNPEGQRAEAEIKLTKSKCNACGRCATVCPTDAVVLNKDEKEKVRIKRNVCTDCGLCINACPTGALAHFGEIMTASQLFEKVRKDDRYYRESGGGVTIGGGEPTSSPFLTYALMKKCQEDGISVAIDTCGYVGSEQGYRILEEADILLYDLKGMNEAKHVDNTGMKNGIILANLKRLAVSGKRIIVRMPLIPGHNDSLEEVRAASQFLSDLRAVEEIDLLPYHKYGTVKYEELGRTYELQIEPPQLEYVDHVKRIFEEHGLKTQIGG